MISTLIILWVAFAFGWTVVGAIHSAITGKVCIPRLHTGSVPTTFLAK